MSFIIIFPHNYQVQHDVDDENKWASCFDQYGVVLPTGYHLGFTSQTGDLSGEYFVHSYWTTMIKHLSNVIVISFKTLYVMLH